MNLVTIKKQQIKSNLEKIPGDQPELSKCMMPLLLNYQSKITRYGLELKRIAEHLLIQEEIAHKCYKTAFKLKSQYLSI